MCTFICGKLTALITINRQNGKWDTLEFGNKLNSALSPPEAVLKAGRNCYTSIRDLFSAGGFDTLLLAIGDHVSVTSVHVYNVYDYLNSNKSRALTLM